MAVQYQIQIHHADDDLSKKEEGTLRKTFFSTMKPEEAKQAFKLCLSEPHQRQYGGKDDICCSVLYGSKVIFTHRFGIDDEDASLEKALSLWPKRGPKTNGLLKELTIDRDLHEYAVFLGGGGRGAFAKGVKIALQFMMENHKQKENHEH